ncbi:hypothetical protein NQ315_006044 [Exocentrus adspersus]|uniref:Uncharacterized protein n=1 Tax=Exocentrus adspersus TaxID=1586481 RepID=A0AAV8VFJ5_9CUCU|nr:hypothetical protein NQ315_006044 [Exocentrus adspersus]
MANKGERRTDAFLSSEVCTDNEQRPALEKLREEVSQTILSRQKYQKEWYDKNHVTPKTFGVGQQVLVRRAKGPNDGQSRKLEPRYKGPFVVTKILDHDRYVINEIPGSKHTRTAYTGICPSEHMNCSSLEFHQAMIVALMTNKFIRSKAFMRS